MYLKLGLLPFFFFFFFMNNYLNDDKISDQDFILYFKIYDN